jgi:transposase
MTQIPAGMEVFDLKFLPIINAFLYQTGIPQQFDDQVELQAHVRPGVWIALMILDTLSGRSPLYHLSEFASTLDCELFFGQDFEPEAFNDDAAGRFLDAVFEAGSMSLFTSCALRAADVYNLDLSHLRFDTTSMSLQGDYNFPETAKLPFFPKHGHSKDHRPDLKQIVMTTLCVDYNVPILASFEDGNASDKTLNHELLQSLATKLSSHSSQFENATYIADSALVTEKNLHALDSMSFITRLPANFNEHDRLIQEAVEAEEWEDLGVLAVTKPTKNRTPASYRISEGTAVLYKREYRAVIVHSSAHDKRRQKKLERRIKESLRSAQDVQADAKKREFACQADAEQEAERIARLHFPLHSIQARVQQRPKYGRGRPPKGGERQVKEMKYGLEVELIEKEEAIAKAKLQQGCFVLLCNLPHEGEFGKSGREVLVAYKEQHGVEQNYGFLKDPVIVNSLLLKKPERLEALGVVLLLSLMVWRLIEKVLRRFVNESSETLMGLDKKQTSRPTTYMVTVLFKQVMIVKLGENRGLASALSEAQQKYLEVLGFDERIFLQSTPDWFNQRQQRGDSKDQ